MHQSAPIRLGFRITRTTEISFARFVLSTETFHSVYTQRNDICSMLMLRPSEEKDFRTHPMLANPVNYIYALNRSLNFRPLPFNLNGEIIAREIVITYQIYFPEVTVTPSEHFLWLSPPSKLQEIARIVGLPYGEELQALRQKAGFDGPISRATAIKALCDIGGIATILPETDETIAVKSFRSPSMPTDWVGVL